MLFSIQSIRLVSSETQLLFSVLVTKLQLSQFYMLFFMCLKCSCLFNMVTRIVLSYRAKDIDFSKKLHSKS